MVIDTSAIFAAIAGEKDAQAYRDAILAAPLRIMSAVTLLETQIVLFSRYGEVSLTLLHDLLDRAAIVVAPFDAAAARMAFEAFQTFGKGRGHKGS